MTALLRTRENKREWKLWVRYKTVADPFRKVKNEPIPEDGHSCLQRREVAAMRRSRLPIERRAGFGRGHGFVQRTLNYRFWRQAGEEPSFRTAAISGSELQRRPGVV
jgi:hypothetical protein